MPKPEVSTEVILEDEEPSSALTLQAERVARRLGGILSHVPVIGPNTGEDQPTPDQLKHQATNDVIQMTHALREQMDKNAATPSARVITDGTAPFDVFVLAQANDTQKREVTDSIMHIKSKSGHKTHLQLVAKEAPREWPEPDLIAPEVEIKIANEAGQFAMDEYNLAEQQELAQVVHEATTVVVEQAQGSKGQLGLA